MSDRIYLSSPHMSDEGYEKEFVQEAFDTNWIVPLGKNVDEFEKELAEYTGCGYAAALSSGTAALHLALKILGVSNGDVVLCQSLTFSASANPIIYQNATPVFIDSEKNTWNMCPIALEQALKMFPQTKAVIVVNLYGIAAELDTIRDICDKYDVKMIEDAAESLGGVYKDDATGTYGDIGIYSFNGNKIITTSGGGMLVTKNKEWADKARFYATQSRENKPYYEHKELGFNYRMSNVCAGIGRGQLKVLADRVAKKTHIFEHYKKHLSDISFIKFVEPLEEDKPNYWLSSILVDSIERKGSIIAKLAEYNIEARHLWKPMHMQPFFKYYDFIGTGVAEKLFELGLCLPSDSKMTENDLLRVVSIIKEVCDA
ncbi:aminotransferase DegT [Candidatus Francisella endociliophora]|uniref:GDP-perosamine synthase n=1 Tax=Candidatus Francisella endociliophora TaxID=653937 RepID=A0A097ER02_9GAMM|nr:DegT/DnrJ/EryC1/StrS family aminotransferase [Francisella sp. FSC1006]AIT10005.1 aminotransferase DegT [Francisella sp. FSC1006]